MAYHCLRQRKIYTRQIKNYYFRSSIVRQLTEDGSHHLPAYVPEKAKLCKQTTIMDLESLTLNPKVEGRIIELTPKVRIHIIGGSLASTSQKLELEQAFLHKSYDEVRTCIA